MIPHLHVTRWGARFAGRDLPCAVGRGGIVPAAKKREGDGATPAGIWRMTGLWYRPDRLPAHVAFNSVHALLRPEGMRPPGWARMRPPWGGRAHARLRCARREGEPDRLLHAPGQGAQPILPRDGWSEDPADPDYNRPIRHPHGFPAERMR
ncbi:MAG: hypothetical protein D6754_06370, partial [Alphaproteobacteria bacterium]